MQDYDPDQANFGKVAEHPELVDINYRPRQMFNREWLNSNSLDYNPERDQILLSARNMSEIWIIDHSTTTAEAAGHQKSCGHRGAVN